MPEVTPEVNRDISHDEYFIRIIRYPYSFKETKPDKVNINRLNPKSLFMPACNKTTKRLEGVSIDRIAYCTLLQSKVRALDNFGMSTKGIPEYVGMAIISQKHIEEINNIPTQELLAEPVIEGTPEDYNLTSLKDDIALTLTQFDITCLDKYNYFGIISTPTDASVVSNRIPPPQPVYINDAGNPAHAEIFYLLTESEPNNPHATIIQALSRELQKKASKEIDTDASCRTTVPTIPLPT